MEGTFNSLILDKIFVNEEDLSLTAEILSSLPNSDHNIVLATLKSDVKFEKHKNKRVVLDLKKGNINLLKNDLLNINCIFVGS